MKLKKGLVLLLTAILTFLMASEVSAEPKAQPLKVLLNGEALVFAQDPVIIENRAYVEFPDLFEKLGYTVEYTETTRTIKAAAPGHKIEMSLGGDAAFVDGNLVDSKGAMKIVSDRTLVGLRFVAGLCGTEVGWDGAKRIVTLTDKGPTRAEEAAVLSVFDKMVAAEAAGDADALASLFAGDTAVDVKAILPEWNIVRTKTTIMESFVQSIVDQVAIVQTMEETVRLSGGYFPDNRQVIRYRLEQDASGQWKIGNLEGLKVEVINTEKLNAWFDNPVTLPDIDKTAIEALLNAQIKAGNEEKTEDYLATMAFKDEAERTAVSESVKNIHSQYDISTTVGKWAVVEYKKDGEATILLSLVSDAKAAGASVGTTKSMMQMSVKKSGGKWLFDPVALILTQEPVGQAADAI